LADSLLTSHSDYVVLHSFPTRRSSDLDGSQGEGINFSVADKLRIAERLDAFGIHYIEGGWPGSNPKDIEFFDQAKRRKFRHALRSEEHTSELQSPDQLVCRMLLDKQNT